MSVVESSSLAAAIDCLRQCLDRTTLPSSNLIPFKRKLDEYAPGDNPEDYSLFVRMRKSNGPESPVSPVINDENRLSHDFSLKAISSENTWGPDSMSVGLHFFVRMLSSTTVIHASPEDTVESVLEHIERVTGIPKFEQQLIYQGRRLQLEQSLAECGVQNDASLQLTGRLRSTDYPGSWIVANDIISAVSRLRDRIENTVVLHTCPHEDYISVEEDSQGVEALVKVFLMMSSKDEGERTQGHLQVFVVSGAAAALVMLYASIPMRLKNYKSYAESSIRHFLNLNSELLPKWMQAQCAPIVLEFCKLLSATVGKADPLYKSCRNTFGLLLESMGVVYDLRYFGHSRPMDVINEILPFVSELAGILSTGLSVGLSLGFLAERMSLVSDVLAEFSNFLLPLQRVIQDRWGGLGPIPLPLCKDGEHTQYEDWFGSLYAIFMELLEKVDHCLEKVGELLDAEGPMLSENRWTVWSLFLVLLTELNGLSKIYKGAGEILHSVLLVRRVPLNALIRHVKRSDDLWWLLKHKDVTDFESRRNLVLMMFPEGKDDYDELHEMLIDRSQILAESFEYIAHADPSSLQSGLFMEFKNEEATGPGVLREWFSLLCRAIFNTQNVLFVSCPNDGRRFFPNPASAVDPLHLDYFGFCGRVIALALMHKVQVGVVFDRVFFLQLAGKLVSLEDVQDADPYLYKSCKKILEMDADTLDSDVLGLTFVREIEELGFRKTVELCPGGKDIVVNSRNRQKYVDLLIRHCFVTCISEQVAHFSQGFNDILSNTKFQRLFFQSLELEDLDQMLGGSGAICTKDWKAHSEYNGYRASDRQICWFWKVVEGMSTKQRRVLLFFWTSVKYLPVDGFGGLASKLYIYRTSDSHDRLPTSHTCFYRLCLPAYPSLSVMRKRLQLVTQEHVGCSFGIW